MANENEMDTILDAALDDLDDDEEEGDGNIERTFLPGSKDEPLDQTQVEHDTKEEKTKPSPAAVVVPADGIDPDKEKQKVAPSEPPNSIDSSSVNNNPDTQWFQSVLKNFIEAEDEGGDPDARLGQFMEQVLSHLPSPQKNKKKGPKSPSPRTQQKGRTNNLGGESTVDETIHSLLEDMAKASMRGDSNTATSGFEQEEELLKGMFQHLQGVGGTGGEGGLGPDSFNADAMLDGMVESLLSKDLMYEPMKQVTELFPSWLEENRSKVPLEEYQQ
jgi:Pex19 protein family